jgi:hypothetical protein
VALRGVKHWTRLLLEGRGAAAPEGPAAAVGIMTCSLPQHLPHATRMWFLFVMMLEFIPKEDCLIIVVFIQNDCT